MEYNLQIYNDFETTLEKIWDEFEKNSANNCFQNFYWLKNWYSSLDNNKNIQIINILVKKNDDLIMILPMCINEYGGIKYLKWQGGDRADVCNLSSSDQIGLLISERWVRDSVEDMCNIANTEIPEMWWRSCPIHSAVDNALEGLISSFKGILMLIIRFTGPNLNPKHS